MKKTYKIEVDCANCAAKMEEAAGKVNGVKEAAISFMAQKMKVEFEEGVSPEEVMQEVRKACRKVESDCEIYL
ncbi:MAG: cation transporter [Lachnospiraceae bacterium]